MQVTTEFQTVNNINVLSAQLVVVDAQEELEYYEVQLEDGSTVKTNHRGEVLDLTRFEQLTEEKGGDHAKIYSGQFMSVIVWRNDVLETEWRWERPMFAHRVQDKVLVVHVDEDASGIADEEGDVWTEANLDKEVIYRRLIQSMQDKGFTFLAGKSKKAVFLRPGVKPEQVLGKVWTQYVTGDKASDTQFIAGMLLRPGYLTEVTKSLPLPTRKATPEMDGVGVVFPEKDWAKLLAYFGLNAETAALQVTYSNPHTGAAFKGTVSVETQGRPAGTYTETWKYLGDTVKSIQLKYLSVMNSDFIINSRSSWNQQMSYYELNDTQRGRIVRDFQLALDQISDLKALAGAGHVITAGHLVKEGLNPFFGQSADEVNEIRRNMALKATRNTPVPGWMLLVQPSLDLAQYEIRVPKRVYKRFVAAKKAGLFDAFLGDMMGLTQRHPTLPTGGSIQRYKIVGISRGNVIEVGMRQTPTLVHTSVITPKGQSAVVREYIDQPGFKLWASAQLGDFDGDQMVLFDPTWAHERLFDFQPKLVNNQEKYKPTKGKSFGTDVVTRIEMLIKEANIAIGLGDSAARQAIDCGMDTPEFLEQCSLAIQTAITSKKHETEMAEVKRPPGLTPVKLCAFQQLKKLKRRQDTDAFAQHWMLPAVEQALDIAEMETQPLEYSHTLIQQVFAQISLLFSKAALTEALDMAQGMIRQYDAYIQARSLTQDQHQRQEINKLIKQLRTIELPLMVETQGVFAAWKPQGFLGNLTTEQDMRRALIALAFASYAPGAIRLWAQAMDRKILELFLKGRGGDELVLLTGGGAVKLIKGDDPSSPTYVELDVRDGGIAYQHNQRVGRFAVDKQVPDNGQHLFLLQGGTDRRMVLQFA